MCLFGQDLGVCWLCFYGSIFVLFYSIFYTKTNKIQLLKTLREIEVQYLLSNRLFYVRVRTFSVKAHHYKDEFNLYRGNWGDLASLFDCIQQGHANS